MPPMPAEPASPGWAMAGGSRAFLCWPLTGSRFSPGSPGYASPGSSGRRRLESLTDTLNERVNKLIPRDKSSEWGSPHLSVTPLSVAVSQLAADVAALQTAVREMALEIQKLSEIT